MSTTMMSFLYQTRTLSSNGWLRSTTVQFKRGANVPQRNFTLSMSVRHSIDRRTTLTTTSNPKPDGELVTKRSTNISDVEPPSASSWAYDSDLRAFTEDKSKFREKPLIRKHMYNPDAHRNREADFDLPKSIDFEEEALNEDDFSGKDEIYQLTDTRGDRESTITPSERHAFQKIFSDIFQRHEKSIPRESSALTQEEPAFTTTEAGETRGSNVRPGNLRQAKTNLADIVSGAISMTREKKEEAVNRYPVALRPAAARAIGLDMDATKIYEEDPIDETQAVIESERMEALREPERLRVEDLMKGAKTDFELWEIMEKEVFSLISKMGLGELPDMTEEAAPPTPKKRGRKSKKEVKKAEVDKDMKEAPKAPPNNVNDDASNVPSLSLYGPLYPSYILLGLRLLDRSFARPSPLALSLLPKIKSMGFISHVLGASTQFYNELIRIYRYRHDDFVGITKLLSEMENAALEMDEETFEVVHDIVQTQLSVQRGDKGKAIKALWKLSEFAPGKFKGWKSKIEGAISTKELRAAGHNDQFFG